MSQDQSAGATPVAVVEIGSGSVKLLVAAQNDAGGLATLAKSSLKTKLSAGIGPDGLIAESALRVTDEAFAEFARSIEEVAAAGPSPTVRVVATAFARAASDLSSLETMVRSRFGVELEVLSGEREAELAFAGAMYGRNRDEEEPVALMDIGSGSTEFAVGRPGHTPGVCSLAVGARTLTDQYLISDPPRADELSSALSVVELYFDDLHRELPNFAPVVENGTLIGVGALIDIAAVEIGLTDPEVGVDGYVLQRTDAEEVFRALATEAAADRKHNPGLKPEHVDDVVGAMCVLVELMRQFGVDEIVISEQGLRHGLSAEMLAGC